MTIIIGLGNPGPKFQNTRHNVGFTAVDKIAGNFQFPIFNFQSIFNAEISKGEISGEKIILAKPQTYMNNSGTAAKKLVKSDLTKNLIIIHDDIDLEIGKIKIVKGRGSAGHKGVESIIKAIGNKDLIRLRIGIKPKQFRALNHGTVKAGAVVLKKFSKQEEKTLDETFEKTAEALNYLIKNGLEKTMNEYNK